MKPALGGRKEDGWGSWRLVRYLGVTMLVVWLQVPSLEKVLEFRAHEGEIEDLALGPDGKVRK